MPGICEYSTCVIDYDYYLNKVDSMKMQCYVHNISPSDYSFIVNTLTTNRKPWLLQNMALILQCT